MTTKRRRLAAAEACRRLRAGLHLTQGEKLRCYRRALGLRQAAMAERYGVTIPVYRAWEQDNGSRATPDVTFDTDVMTFTDLSWLYRRRLGLTLKAAAATAGKSTSWAHNAEQALSPRAIEEMTEYLLEQRRKDGGW